ncbi:MAG TPA: serine/threonine-protein kinase [Planctomycetota bacterium]|nr:serine/threonine-protein kinase [Planctomycetota bacterium]
MRTILPSEHTQGNLLAALGAFTDQPRVPSSPTPPTETPDDRPAEPPAPQRIAGVRLVRLLERGGCGAVYLGRHETMDVDVAVKLMPEAQGDGDAFVREARAIARLRHPHVVSVLNAGRDAGWCYIVMELVSGGDLLRLVRHEGPVPWRRALRYAAEVADGLGATHRIDYIHGDIKLGNLMLADDGSVKIADLGVARRRGSRRRPGGTPAYLAPEVLAGAPAEPTADIYALGISLYVLLTGEHPLPDAAASDPTAGERHSPADPRARLPELPAAVADLVRHLCETDPGDRPRDGATAATAIRHVLAQGSSEDIAVRRTPTRRTRRAWRAIGAVGSVAAAVALIIGYGGTALARSVDATAPADVIGAAAGAYEASRPPSGGTSATASAPAPAVGDAGSSPAASRWTTPPRAVFLLADDLPLAVEEAIETRLRATRLPVIDRPNIDVLVREQALASAGRVDATTAIQIGHLIGGHIGLFVRAQDGHVRCAVVCVETGQRLASALVAADGTAAAAERLVLDAAAALPARGTVARDADGALRVDLGRRHGLRVGDRLRVLAADDASDGSSSGEAVAAATVVEVSDDRALVSIAGREPTQPARVERIASTGAR